MSETVPNSTEHMVTELILLTFSSVKSCIFHQHLQGSARMVSLTPEYSLSATPLGPAVAAENSLVGLSPPHECQDYTVYLFVNSSIQCNQGASAYSGNAENAQQPG